MKPLRSWRKPSRNTALLFLGVASVSVAALIWMGLRIVRQERALEVRQLEERRETAAGRVTASLENSLSAEERWLGDARAEDFAPGTADGLLVVADAGGIRVQPENGLLYYPVVPSGREASALLFAEAERTEFLEQDYLRATDTLRFLAGSKNSAVRVGAQLRMARNLRKAGRLEAALDTYEMLSGSSASGITVSGVASDLVARRARCLLLEELARGEELRQEALNLRDDLSGGRWRLDRASYAYYSEQVNRWLDGEYESHEARVALAEAVGWLWKIGESGAGIEPGPSGRKALRFEGTSVAILWRFSESGWSAIVAGPDFQKRCWFEPAIEGSVFVGVGVNIRDPDGGFVYGNDPRPGASVTARRSFATGLPWDIAVVNDDLEAVRSQFAQRRRLMMAGLGTLALLVITASYLIGRAVSRELAAAQLQSDFVSAVSHEFRTPLTSMRQFTEMLVEDENLSVEKRRGFYQAQERATRRLSRLVESLLDFGRMEAGARPYRLQELDAGRLVRAVAAEFKQETDSVGVEITFSAPDRGPVVKADREALVQALWNLLDNAVKYSGGGAEVHVEIEAGDPVAIRVRDRGIGIPPSERDRIFRKFVRGSSAKMQGVKGTGIGLAMVKHIVGAHGGKVVVESEPGKGSTFTIQLPAGG